MTDALLDLHAKLSTVVRYYDRMLEERLSNTYSQHTIGGYNLPPQRPASTMYPSISSNVPSGAGTAESFYTGNSQQEAYGRPQSTYAYGAPPQQYQQYDRRASVASPGFAAPEQRNETYNQYPSQQTPKQKPPQPQRTVSWQTPDVTSTPYASQAQVYPPENAPQPQQQVPPSINPQQQAPPPINAPSQPPTNFGPSEPAMTPSADPNAAFYYNTPAPGSQIPQAQEPNPQQYPPPHQSPQQYHTTIPQPVSPQQYVRQPQKPQEQYAPPPQQQAPPPQQTLPPQHQPQQASYWPAQQQQQQASQQPWQTPTSTYTGYTQESFPSAPNHTPQAKVVEESLIDL